jgi:hypothetical protein
VDGNGWEMERGEKAMETQNLHRHHITLTAGKRFLEIVPFEKNPSQHSPRKSFPSKISLEKVPWKSSLEI